MLGIFQGRGLFQEGEGVFAQIDVTMREHLHEFNTGKSLNPLGIFLAIALHANKDGWAWPSRELIKKETGIKGDAAITSALKHLRGMKINGQRVFAHYRVQKDGQWGQSAYLIFPDLPHGVAPFDDMIEFSTYKDGLPYDNPHVDKPLVDNHRLQGNPQSEVKLFEDKSSCADAQPPQDDQDTQELQVTFTFDREKAEAVRQLLHQSKKSEDPPLILDPNEIAQMKVADAKATISQLDPCEHQEILETIVRVSEKKSICSAALGVLNSEMYHLAVFYLTGHDKETAYTASGQKKGQARIAADKLYEIGATVEQFRTWWRWWRKIPNEHNWQLKRRRPNGSGDILDSWPDFIAWHNEQQARARIDEQNHIDVPPDFMEQIEHMVAARGARA